ncbi:MAG: TOBE domain-containing protein [Deinococcales bacterium]
MLSYLSTQDPYSQARWLNHPILLLRESLPFDLVLDRHIKVGIRPEHVIFAAAGREHHLHPSESLLKGIISQDIAQGTDHLLKLILKGGGELEVLLSSLAYGRLGLALGEEVHVILKAQHLKILR